MQVPDCSGPLTMARTALLGALVVLANALSALVIVKTRVGDARAQITSDRPVVATGPTPKQRRRKRLAPRRMP
jgi:hypothetical protein